MHRQPSTVNVLFLTINVLLQSKAVYLPFKENNLLEKNESPNTNGIIVELKMLTMKVWVCGISCNYYDYLQNKTLKFWYISVQILYSHINICFQLAYALQQHNIIPETAYMTIKDWRVGWALSVQNNRNDVKVV